MINDDLLIINRKIKWISAKNANNRSEFELKEECLKSKDFRHSKLDCLPDERRPITKMF